jgi:hypothetical protein
MLFLVPPQQILATKRLGTHWTKVSNDRSQSISLFSHLLAMGFTALMPVEIGMVALFTTSGAFEDGSRAVVVGLLKPRWIVVVGCGVLASQSHIMLKERRGEGESTKQQRELIP